MTKDKTLSSLPFALENRMEEYSEALEKSKINKDITNVLLTILFYIIFLSIFSWIFLLTSTMQPPGSYFQLLNFDLQRLKFFIPMVTLYIGFIYCAIVSYHDFKYQIKRSDNALYQIGGIFSFILLVLIILSSKY